MKYNIWFIKIENPKTNIKFTIYNDGLVFGTKRNEKLFVLTEKAVSEIKAIIKVNIYMLRTMRYLNHSKEGFIIRINDTSRKHQDIIKIVGWSYEKRILDIIQNRENIKEILLSF